MALRILPLEQRIVLDAAAVVTIAAADAVDQGPGHEALDDVAVSPVSSESSVQTDPDASADAVSAVESGVKVLVVPTDSDSPVLDSIGDDVLVIAYDAETASLAKLQESIADALGDQSADSITFVNLSDSGDEFSLLADQVVPTSEITGDPELQQFWLELGSMLGANGHIDVVGVGMDATADAWGGQAALEPWDEPSVLVFEGALSNPLEPLSSEAIGGMTALSGDEATDRFVASEATDDLSGQVLDSLETTEEELRLLLVSSSVDDAADLVAAAEAMNNVEVLYYDADTASLDSLWNDINDLLNGRTVASVGIVTHGDIGEFYLTSDHTVDAGALQDSAMKAFWEKLGGVLDAGGRVDLFGCNIDIDGGGAALVSGMEELLGSDVASSIDNTGNLAFGGNWVLESNDIQVNNLYFNSTLLHDFEGVLTSSSKPPVNYMPGTQTMGVDTSLVLSGNNAISIYDKDSNHYPGAEFIVRLEADHGTLSLATTNGLVFNVGDGFEDGVIEMVGTKAEINAALDGLVFTAEAGYVGNANLEITTDDQGFRYGNYNDTPQQDVDVLWIYVDGVILENSVPGTQVAEFGSSVVFSTAAGNAVSVFYDDGETTTQVSNPNGGTAASMSGSGSQSGSSGATGSSGSHSSGSQTETAGTQGTTSHGDQTTDHTSTFITVTDEDWLVVTLSAENGFLTLADHSNITFTSGDGVSDSTMTFYGQVADINAALEGLTWIPGEGFYGQTTIQIHSVEAEDGGSPLNGGLTDTDDILITMNPPPNEGPENVLPASQVMAEDNTLVFSSGTGNEISVSDDGAGSGTLTVTLSVDTGVMDLSTTDGLSFSVGDGSGDGTMTFTGSVADVNAALAGMSYAPPENYYGPVEMTMETNDGEYTDTDTMAITVTPVNDAPDVVGPAVESTVMDTPVVFSAATGNAITISDIDVGDGIMRFEIEAGNGTLTLGSMDGLNFLEGDGTDDVRMVFEGTLAEINAALDGLSFDPAVSWTGNTFIKYEVNDQGNTGPVAENDEAITYVTVDPPDFENVVPPTQFLEINTDLEFKADNGNVVSITGVHDDTWVKVLLQTDNGTLSLSQTDGLSFGSGDGTNDSIMWFLGQADDVKAALDCLVFTPDSGWVGETSISMTSELSYPGEVSLPPSPSAYGYDHDVFSIVVEDTVNDPPELTIPDDQVMREDTALTFSTANGNALSVYDSDPGEDVLWIRLQVDVGHLTLSTTDGLTFTQGDGSADGFMEFRGTETDINAALEGLVYQPPENFNGDVVLSLNADDGEYPADGSFDIVVEPVNDAPVLTAPDFVNMAEDSTLVFSGGNTISVADVDAGDGDVLMILRVDSGSFSLSQVDGLNFLSGDGSNDTYMKFEGSLDAINAALDGMSFEPEENFNGVVQLRMDVNDQGNSPDPALSDWAVTEILVMEGDDGSEIEGPLNEQTYEDIDLVFSEANGNGISLSFDDGPDEIVELKIVLDPGTGTFSLSQLDGLTFFVGDGIHDTEMHFEGTISQINAALDGLTYHPALNYNGDSGLLITVFDEADVDDDDGSQHSTANSTSAHSSGSSQTGSSASNTATGGGETGSGSTDTLDIHIDVLPVDDAPEWAAPVYQTTAEDTAIVFSEAAGNGISVSMEDGPDEIMTVYLKVPPLGTGNLTLSTTDGLTFAEGDGSNDQIMRFTGTVGDINAALEGLVFEPAENYNGDSGIWMGVFDFNDGPSGPEWLTDAHDIDIDIVAVDDPSDVEAPDEAETLEDTPLVFHPDNGNAITLTMEDGPNEVVTLKITLAEGTGTFSLGSLDGLEFVSGDGVNDTEMVLKGTLADINATLEGLTYNPALNYNGDSGLELCVVDYNDDTGEQVVDVHNIEIDVLPVDDAPEWTAPTYQTTPEDTQLVFSVGSGNGISISMEDGPDEVMTVALKVPPMGTGTITLSTLDGLTFNTGDGVGDQMMVFTGTVSDINAALEGLVFDPASNYNGDSGIWMGVYDFNDGPSGPEWLTDAHDIDIDILAGDDPSEISAPDDARTLEDTDLVFSSENGNPITLSMVDGPDEVVTLKITLAEGTGTFSLGSLDGLEFATGDGVNDTEMVFKGTLADINAALEGLTYHPELNYNGPSGLELCLVDHDDATGEPVTDVHTVDIDVIPVDDAPEWTAPTYQTTPEDTAIVFSEAAGNGISVSMEDGPDEVMTVYLKVPSMGTGTLTLSTTDGLTFTEGDGSDDQTMTFTGTVGDINAALEGLVFEPAENYNGDSGIWMGVYDFNDGPSGPEWLTDGHDIDIDIVAVDDPSEIDAPDDAETLEDTDLVFSTENGNPITLSTLDGPNEVVALKITLAEGTGTFSLGSLDGLEFVSGDGVNDTEMVFKGTLADINAALEGLTYHPELNYNGPSGLELCLVDHDDATGEPVTDVHTVDIDVIPVDDAPEWEAPIYQTTPEDTAIVFSAGNGNGISISMEDGPDEVMTVYLKVPPMGTGTLTLSTFDGLTFATGDGTDDQIMVFSGTVGDINAALEGLVFEPTHNYNGDSGIWMGVYDPNDGPSGPAWLTDAHDIDIDIIPVDDASEVDGPQQDETFEDTPLVFSEATGNAISLTMEDGPNEIVTLKISLEPGTGTFSLSTIDGLTFAVGDGSMDTEMVFEGTLADINAALEGLTYEPALNYNGPSGLELCVIDHDDATGDPNTDIHHVAITVHPVDDPPVLESPGPVEVLEDTALEFKAENGNAITISMPDGPDELHYVKITLPAGTGTFSLGSIDGLSFLQGDGVDDNVMVFKGSAADINAALECLVYNPAPDYNGDTSIWIGVFDPNDTGGPDFSTEADIPIEVIPVNDPPVNNLPAGQVTAEDTDLVFVPGINGVSFSDVDVVDPDNDTQLYMIELSVTDGSLTLSGIDGLTFTIGDGSGDSVMVFTGTFQDINNALENMFYSPAANYQGEATLTMTTTETDGSGNLGLSDHDASTITITPVDDIPEVESPNEPSGGGNGSAEVFEDSTLVFSTAGGNPITIVDVDGANEVMEIILKIENGTLTLSGTDGLVFTLGDGTDDTVMAFRGTLAEINAALDGLVYEPTADYFGPAELSLTVIDPIDPGGTSSYEVSQIVDIDVIPVDDPPVNTVPDTQQMLEDGVLTFSVANGNALSIADIDAFDDQIEVRLSVDIGSLSLGSMDGITFIEGDGTEDGMMVLQGTLTDINAALEGMTYTPPADFFGEVSFTIHTDDMATTAGGPLQDTDSFLIVVGSVDDPLEIDPPGPQKTLEDTPLTFSKLGENHFNFFDRDSVQEVVLNLSVSLGELDLPDSIGVEFLDSDGTDGQLSLKGTPEALTRALEGLLFSPPENYNGPAVLSFTVDDPMTPAGFSGSVDIDVIPVNDPPELTYPGLQTLEQGSGLIFNELLENAIGVMDVDTDEVLTLTIQVPEGTLFFADLSGVTVLDAAGDNLVIISGDMDSLNAALQTLTFLPPDDFSGLTEISLSLTDGDEVVEGGVPIQVNESNEEIINVLDDLNDRSDPFVRDGPAAPPPAFVPQVSGTTIIPLPDFDAELQPFNLQAIEIAGAGGIQFEAPQSDFTLGRFEFTGLGTSSTSIVSEGVFVANGQNDILLITFESVGFIAIASAGTTIAYGGATLLLTQGSSLKRRMQSFHSSGAESAEGTDGLDTA